MTRSSARESWVRPGDIGNRTYRRDRLHFGAKRVVKELDGFFLQIDVAQIVVHKTHQPDTIIYLLDSDGLTRQRSTEIDCSIDS